MGLGMAFGEIFASLMLSAVELKKGFFMPFKGYFKPLMWALSGTGSLSSTPAVFLDIRLDN